MGYYENPPIIDQSEGYEQIAAGALDATKSISDALLARKNKEIKDDEKYALTIQKLQAEKTKTDLYYTKKMSDFSAVTDTEGNVPNKKIKSLLQTKIHAAADAQIALTMETDPAKRSEYLKMIGDADEFMTRAGKVIKNMAPETASWSQNAAPIAVGQPGGWAVNGKTSKEIKERTMFLEIMGGMGAAYEDDYTIDIVDQGGSFALKARARRKGEKDFIECTVGAEQYLNSDEKGTGGLLMKVENVDEFYKTAGKKLTDEDGSLLPAYLDDTTESVRVKSEGDQYVLHNAKRVNIANLKKAAEEEASIKASGYLRAGGEASLNSLINYSLQKGPTYYADNFEGKDVEFQKTELTRILTDDLLKRSLRKLETTTEDGETVYWTGKGMRKVVEKQASTSSGKTTGAKQEKLGAREKSQLEFQKEVEKVAKAGKGRVLGPGGWRLDKMDGRWGIFNRQGDQMFGTEGITQPTELATFIGYKKGSKPKLKG